MARRYSPLTSPPMRPSARTSRPHFLNGLARQPNSELQSSVPTPPRSFADLKFANFTPQSLVGRETNQYGLAAFLPPISRQTAAETVSCMNHSVGDWEATRMEKDTKTTLGHIGTVFFTTQSSAEVLGNHEPGWGLKTNYGRFPA
ncbi:hypothetical protein B0H14DRAFT_2582690 [Mycena olivaceomarginata]|nr:hypothetical protein B0H14DRAFT_2582690 [Mycena olivaceomarginata]